MNFSSIGLIVNDYFTCSSNEKKKSLEAELLRIKEHRDTLQIALQSIQITESMPLLQFYFLSVFEVFFINQHHQLWNRTKHSEHDILYFRGFLWNLITTEILKENYLRNKLVKLIVDVGRHEYPIHWPSFLQDTFNVSLISPSIALLLTKTIVEEFYGSRQDISTAQTTTLKNALNSNMNELLNGIVVYNLLNGYNALSGLSPVSDSPHFTSPVSPFPSPTNIVPLSSQEYKQNSKTAFEILQLLITFVPNQDPFWTSGCIDAMLKYVLVDLNDYEWTFMVLVCLDELFSKPTISLGATNFLPRIMDTLSQILANHVQLFQNDGLDVVPDGYTTKVIELMDHIVSNHLDSFQLMDKLKLQQLYVQTSHFTFSLSTIDDATNMMKIWETLIETTATTQPGLESLFLGLMEGLLQESRYQIDGPIDTSHLILDICGMMATYYPNPTIHLLFSKYYKGLETIQTVFQSGWNQHLSPLIKEMSMIVLAIGRLAILCEDHFQEHVNLALPMLQNNISLLQSLCALQNPDPVFYILGGNVFESLNMYMNWIAKYQSVSMNTENTAQCQSFIVSLVECALKATIVFPSHHRQQSSRLLSYGTSRLKPDLKESVAVSQFLLHIQTETLTESIPVFSNIWKFATNHFIYFSMNYKPQPHEWLTKTNEFVNFISPVLRPIPLFFQMDMTKVDQAQVRQQLLYTFQIIESVALATNESNAQTRDVSFQSIYPVIKHLPSFFQIFKNDEQGLIKITELMTILINVFKKQLSKSDVAYIVPQTLGWCQSYILDPLLENEAIQTECFKLFDMLMEDKSKLFDTALPNMISFCVELHSRAIQYKSSEKMGQLYSLVDRILYYHYTYFFAQKVQSLKGAISHPNEFMDLFQVFVSNIDSRAIVLYN